MQDDIHTGMQKQTTGALKPIHANGRLDKSFQSRWIKGQRESIILAFEIGAATITSMLWKLYEQIVEYSCGAKIASCAARNMLFQFGQHRSFKIDGCLFIYKTHFINAS
nr:hypothetical protein [Tanacetum cinerariifolium]